MANQTPVIPETVTVHLGAPDAPAANVTVPFAYYAKNVASSELYPTWPENALRANIYAQLSVIMNRIYTEYYRSRGYDFDVTNSPAFDQTFVNGRDVFENVGQLVDEIFNSYLVRPGFIEPFFAQYCDGIEVSCNGLSQWGSVTLAEQGMTPFEILQYYYGDNINIKKDVPVQAVSSTAPPIPLRIGSVSNDVKSVQVRLNRISQNYPAIPKIANPDGVFTSATEEAVKEFQRIFSLSPDGVVGNGTWFRIQAIYNAVKRLNELNSEGLTLTDISTQFPEVLRPGDTGDYVRTLQYFLNFLATYTNYMPSVVQNGIYDAQTENAVFTFQTLYGLDADGIVGEITWNELYNAYLGILESLPQSAFTNTPQPYPGNVQTLGSTGEPVVIIQDALNVVGSTYPQIGSLPVTGVFSTMTQQAVITFQNLFGLEATGNVAALTWERLTQEASDIQNGNIRADGQFA